LKVKWRRREILEPYPFEEGVHRIRFEEVIDTEEPFTSPRTGRPGIRTTIRDMKTGKLYRWWLDVRDIWDEEEGCLVIPEWSTGYVAQLLRDLDDVSKLVGREYEVRVTGIGRDRRYSIKLLAVPLEEAEVPRSLLEDAKTLLDFRISKETVAAELSKKYDIPSDRILERIEEVVRRGGG